jgi:predicted Zn-dependent protease
MRGDGNERVWDGVYFDGKSAARHPVSVTRTREGLRIRGATVGEIAWAHHEMRRDMRVAADEPVRYERGGETPEVLVIADPSFLPAVRSVFSGGGDPRVDAPPSRGLARLILPALAVLAGVVTLYAWAVPRLAERVAQRVPLEWEESLGRTVATTMAASARVCAEPERMAALNQMVATLTADGRGGRYRYNVTVVDDPTVNAFAAPGGELVIFTGLLQQASAPEELAGVLAHEIQHVVLQHGAKGVLRRIPLQLALGALTGNEGIGTSVTQLAVTLGGLTYQRRDEADADREGMRLLQAARVAPGGMLSFFRKLAEQEDAGNAPQFLNYLSTHPNSEARLDALSALAGSATYEPVPILSDAQWTAVTAACSR